MNAAETIAAAIEKLETLNVEVVGLSPGFYPHGGARWVGDRGLWLDTYDVDATECVVTLHRTIDPILTILRHALARAESKIATGGNARSVWSHEIDAENLASAVLGGDS
jgi:hypothetical protein